MLDLIKNEAEALARRAMDLETRLKGVVKMLFGPDPEGKGSDDANGCDQSAGLATYISAMHQVGHCALDDMEHWIERLEVSLGLTSGKPGLAPTDRASIQAAAQSAVISRVPGINR